MGPLAFDLWPQLAQGAPGSSKGASLTIDLGNTLAQFLWVTCLWCIGAYAVINNASVYLICIMLAA